MGPAEMLDVGPPLRLRLDCPPPTRPKGEGVAAVVDRMDARPPPALPPLMQPPLPPPLKT